MEGEEGDWDDDEQCDCCVLFCQGELEHLQLDALDDDDDEHYSCSEHDSVDSCQDDIPDELIDELWHDAEFDRSCHEGRLAFQHGVEALIDNDERNFDECNVDSALVCADLQRRYDGHWDRYSPSTHDLCTSKRTGIVPRRSSLPHRRSQHLLAVQR